MEPIISVNNISKLYRIYNRPVDRLKQALWRGKKQFYTPVWALKDVSFDIQKGEVFGVIGMNGAGKTTLLQVLAGILPPTTGELKTSGRILNLIELGGGMNFEYTGRENIIQYGLILGQSKKHLEKHIEKAVAFANIGNFIDQPLKTYSTGMIMRLAFSVITICEPDVLLVDEIISVGDMNFRMKCFNWLDEFIYNGGTMCIVSHDINLISNKCRRVAYIKEGRIHKCGSPLEVVQTFRYDSFNSLPDPKKSTETSSLPETIRRKGDIPENIIRKGNRKGLLTRVLINDQEIGSEVVVEQNGVIRVTMEAVFTEIFKNYSFCILFVASNGGDIFSISSSLTDIKHPAIYPNKPVKCDITVNHRLQPGEYYLQPGLADVQGKMTAELLDALELYTKLTVTGTSATHGYVEFPYSIEFPEMTG